MKGVDFPIFKTKRTGDTERFNLNDPEERKKYFALKAGPEIEKLRAYLKKGNTFVGYLLGKKNSGKGTYSKLFMEAIGGDPSTGPSAMSSGPNGSGHGHVGHVAVGDIVRDVHTSIETEEGKKIFREFMEKNYRGFHSLEEIEDLILGRSTASLVSTELILALLKFEISRRPRQALFIDGFPRGLDQIGYSLFLKELLGYRDDPDFFIFINLPNTFIEERIKTRVICPICKTPRSLKLLATKEAGYDERKKEFYLMCDDPKCNKARMVPKEGDELGIEPIRKRLEVDDEIFKKLLSLQGVPKVYLRNSVPVANVDEFVEQYELTPEYRYELESGKVKIVETPWIAKDDEGVDSYSLLPPAVVLGMIKQIVQVLGL